MVNFLTKNVGGRKVKNDTASAMKMKNQRKSSRDIFSGLKLEGASYLKCQRFWKLCQSMPSIEKVIPAEETLNYQEKQSDWIDNVLSLLVLNASMPTKCCRVKNCQNIDCDNHALHFQQKGDEK